MIRSLRLGLVLVAVAVLAGPAAADTPEVAAGKKFVADQQATVTRVMHPTAKLLSTEPVVVTESPTGFVLTVTYRFQGSLKELFYSQMVFSFDANGRFGGVMTRASNSYVKPFTAANAGLAVVRELAAKELQIKKDSVWKLVLSAVNAQTALDLYLKAKQPGRTPSTPPPVSGTSN